jgi:hypothetical protein
MENQRSIPPPLQDGILLFANRSERVKSSAQVRPHSQPNDFKNILGIA